MECCTSGHVAKRLQLRPATCQPAHHQHSARHVHTLHQHSGQFNFSSPTPPGPPLTHHRFCSREKIRQAFISKPFCKHHACSLQLCHPRKQPIARRQDRHFTLSF